MAEINTQDLQNDSVKQVVFNLGSAIIQNIANLLMEQKMLYLRGDDEMSLQRIECIITLIYSSLSEKEIKLCNKINKIISSKISTCKSYAKKDIYNTLTNEEVKIFNKLNNETSVLVKKYIRYVMVLLRKYGFDVPLKADSINQASINYSTEGELQ